MTDATPESRSLAEIGAEFGSDKLSHRYLQFYENLFATIRHEPVRLLELGVGGWEHPDDSGYGGHSLRMWREYFPQGQVVGLDILDKSEVADDRISIARGSQTDETLLRELVSAYGPFDIVIDDGSHIPDQVGASFAILFPLLTDDGIYCIEDIQTSYWPLCGGRFRPRSNRTSMALVKARLDGLNHAEFKLPGYRPTLLDQSIVEVRAQHNIVAFRKGDNTHRSSMNHSLPIAPRLWLTDELIPAAVARARTPAMLTWLDRLGLRRAAARLRRFAAPAVDRERSTSVVPPNDEPSPPPTA